MSYLRSSSELGDKVCSKFRGYALFPDFFLLALKLSSFSDLLQLYFPLPLASVPRKILALACPLWVMNHAKNCPHPIATISGPSAS